MKSKDNLSINIRGHLEDFREPKIMGILNVTDDSFYGGCRTIDEAAIAARVRQIRDEGADMIDIGGCSTRPGSEPVEEEMEWRRVSEAISITRREWGEAVISVDTFRATVAKKSVERGADMINDVTGGSDEEMLGTVAELRVPYVLTHMRGTSATMEKHTDYRDVTADVLSEIAYKLRELRERGACDIILDPGFGFAKTAEQNYRLMRDLDEFSRIGLPVLVGISRKSMIWKPMGLTPEESLPGTIALNTYAMLHGADILRVHDVAAAVQSRAVVAKLRGGEESPQPKTI